jgi:hypothetical protein
VMKYKSNYYRATADPTGTIAVEKSGCRSCCTSQEEAAKSEVQYMSCLRLQQAPQ